MRELNGWSKSSQLFWFYSKLLYSATISGMIGCNFNSKWAGDPTSKFKFCFEIYNVERGTRNVKWKKMHEFVTNDS